MKTKICLNVVLLLCGLAQAQSQFQWPPSFCKNELMPMPLAEPMSNEDGKALPVLSHTLISARQSQQTFNAPQQVWVARYKGTSDSYGVDVAADYAGNVYILGGMKSAFLTIKYNSFGAKQWNDSYILSGKCESIADGIGGRYWECQDVPIKIIVDYNEAVYVAGSSGSDTTCVTLKYNSAGYIQWPKFNKGVAADFVVDNKENVYITGTSLKGLVTVKYNKAGVEQWIKRHDAPSYGGRATAIALDPSGNICVAGLIYVGKNGTSDYVTIKYSPTGITKWVKYYNGPGNKAREQAMALAVDKANNIYVTGYSTYRYSHHITTVKYDQAGKKQWQAQYQVLHYGPLKMRVDGFENVYIAGYGFNGATAGIIKYNKSGVLAWSVQQGENYVIINDMFVDNWGSIYVTGSGRLPGGPNLDFITLKYNSAGQKQWALSYNGPQNGNDYARALAVDGSGNVYVTGESYGLGQNDIVTIKYAQNSSGVSASTLSDADQNSEAVVASEINLPKKFYLSPSYPNPFSAHGTFDNPGTTIRFGLPQAARVTLKVYNVLSAEIATLVDGPKPAGVHAVDFTPKKDLPSGIYFAVLTAGQVRLVQRMIYTK